MTRTTAYKAIYFGIIIGLVSLFGGVIFFFRVSPKLFLPFALLLLVPGRVLGFFWRDLLTGLRLLNLKDYGPSKAHSERFLHQVRQKPWIKHLVWLGSSTYSRDPEVLALNNLGSAEIGLGQYDAARAHFDDAIKLDPKCPLPFSNMGVLALHTGSVASAQPWFEKAQTLGYTGGGSDRIVMAAQTRFAQTDGHANKITVVPPPPRKPAPPLVGEFAVEIIDDDETKVEFVVEILEEVFGLTGIDALRIMLKTQKNGRGICGVYDLETAEAKVKTVTRLAEAAGVPLKCVVVKNLGTAVPIV